MNANRFTILLVALGAAVALWFYSRTDEGASLVDDATGGALDFIDVSASRIKNAITSRGYANNNPGNIRYLSSNAWNGQVGNDNGLGVYDSPQSGTRALGHQLLADAAHGLNTVSALIGSWAPPSENDTHAYIADVAGELDVDPFAAIDVGDRLADLAAAIAKHENGYVDDSYDWNWVYLS